VFSDPSRLDGIITNYLPTPQFKYPSFGPISVKSRRSLLLLLPLLMVVVVVVVVVLRI